MKGEILFSIQTFMGVRLLEYAAENGIPVKDISTPDAHTLNVWIKGSDEKAFRRLIERYGLPFTVVSVRGRAKIKKTIRSHIALSAGLAIGLALVYFLSLRIWLINITGAGSDMRKSLIDAGVTAGKRKSSVDVNAVSRLLEAGHPEYAHIGVKISGVILRIDCVKAESAPGVFDISKARNLIAKTDGVIEKINVFAGKAQVRSGDTVFKGDVLIAGEERAGKNGEITPVRAEGSVTARIWTKGESAVRLIYEKNIRTGKSCAVTEIHTPFFTKKLAGENRFRLSESETRESRLVGLFIPVRLIRTTFYEAETETFAVDTETAERISLENALMNARRNAPEDAQEIRFWAEHNIKSENTIVCKAVVEWITEIAIDEQGG